MAKKKQYQRKDALYHKAKEEGFASRAAYKLIELNKRFNLIRRGFKVLDLGAWPGGWMQVVAPIVGPEGTVVGIDLVELDEINLPCRFKAIIGDVTDETYLDEALDFANGRFDLILSDMSPKITGIRLVDEAALSNIYDAILGACAKCLRPRGNMVLKAFKGNEGSAFYQRVRPMFENVKRCELDATRKSSNEYYIVGLNFKDDAACQLSQPSPDWDGE